MQFPLVERHVLSDLRLVHAFYNISVVLLFWHQALLGMKIRSMRLDSAPLPFPAIRRHRANGPVLAAAAFLGYLLGPFIVFLEEGEVLEHPPHFIAGSTIIFFIAVNVVISRRIRGQSSASRRRHFLTGIVILALYAVQIMLGARLFL